MLSTFVPFFFNFFLLHLHIPLFPSDQMYTGECRMEMHTPRLSKVTHGTSRTSSGAGVRGLANEFLPDWGCQSNTVLRYSKNTLSTWQNYFCISNSFGTSDSGICPFEKNTLSKLLNEKKERKMRKKKNSDCSRDCNQNYLQQWQNGKRKHTLQLTGY